MNTNEALERMVTDRMASDAAGYRSERGLDDALAQMSRMRPYPQWLALLKEPPMRIPSRVVVGSPTFRLVSIMALTLLLALIAGGAVVAGASLLPSPAPDVSRPVAPAYGLAKNGSIAYTQDYDIYLADADGKSSRVIIGGSGVDVDPWFSPDGTRLAYIHDPFGQEVLTVANADGTDQRPVVSHPLAMGFLPSATGEVVRDLPLGDIVPTAWTRVISRPPDGAELIFNGWPTAGSTDKGIYAIPTDGSAAPRRIGDLSEVEADAESEGSRTPGGDQQSFQEMVVQPDGTTVMYWNWEADTDQGGVMGPSIHVRNLTTGAEVPVSFWGPILGHGNMPQYSPDGSMVAFESAPSADRSPRLYYGSVDGQDPSVEVGGPYSIADRQGFAFSPDGKKVLYTSRRGATLLVDLTTGRATPLDGLNVAPESMPSWQRLALTP